jgi:hypothetical protein
MWRERFARLIMEDSTKLTYQYAPIDILADIKRQLEADGHPPIWLRMIELYGEAMFNDGLDSRASGNLDSSKRPSR